MPIERRPGRAAPLFLASVTSAAEALAAVAGGADIIDCKNPSAGALGALPLETVRAIRAAVPRSIPVSATIGDLALDPQAIAERALTMAATGIDYVKIGFFPGGDARATIGRLGEAFNGRSPDTSRAGRSRGMKSHGVAPTQHPSSRARRSVLHGVQQRARDDGSEVTVEEAPPDAAAGLVGLLLADKEPDFALIGAMAAAGFGGVMLDTAGKADGPLTHVMPRYRLQVFLKEVHRLGLPAGLAGSLRLPDIAPLAALGADILGFRGALCRGTERTAALDSKAVAGVRRAIDAVARPAREEAQRA